MTATSTLQFKQRPSALAYMAQAFLPRADSDHRAVPAVRARWSRAMVSQSAIIDFRNLTGLSAGASLPILFLQTWAFRLQMAVLTSRAFPLPLWGALQIRNHLLQHRPIASTECLDLETRVAARRALDKGVEFDLHTTAHAGGDLAWEGLTTFYYRGRMGGADSPSPLARGPTSRGGEIARWIGSGRHALRFARLTGDYNGVHWSDTYARRFGFAGAFHHPQRIVGQCLARLNLPDDVSTQRLDVWLKGPVFYDRVVALHGLTPSTTTAPFELRHENDERSAIVGQWRVVGRGSSLVDRDGVPEAAVFDLHHRAACSREPDAFRNVR